MNFIIFDLEATCWVGSPPSKEQETIEIGALRINSYGEVEGDFNKFIQPVLNPNLSSYCIELTSIRQLDVDRANKFPEVIEHFQDWALLFEEDYVLASWGGFDKTILQHDCRLHDMDDGWLEPHINLKEQYREMRGFKKAKGLKAALQIEGFEFSGTHHRAISDAENLAKIFLKYLDMWRF